ncbi:MAG TPA: hypothetical protein VLG28_12120 [Acidimicrobiia bacterium]|nr:hypothetical protein [Acidimicrobiia bacterium]
MSTTARRFTIVAVFSMVLLALAPLSSAGAGHDEDPRTKNLHPMGHIEEPASLFYGPLSVHTDIAFWGKYAFQGNWQGFNIRDISAPGNPKHISFTSCNGNQGDVIVWDDVLVRSWNSPASGTQDCDGTIVPAGFEGVHIFDISDLSDPALVAAVETDCGSHTATGVPDLENNRLLVYNSSANGACPGLDIIEVPLDNPAASSYIRFVDAGGRDCHDTGVILGDAMMAACAGDDGYSVFSLAGSLDDPQLLYSRSIDGVGIGHSAMFSWDGEIIVFGHEPGGGVAPFCQETTDVIDKSALFFDADTGDLLGMWTLPRPQSATENCTVHNYNMVPMPNGADIMVSGNYQSGTSVVDFTDPANPVELAYSDPPPIDPIDLGGAWSSYWYNNFIYETNITEGLNIFRFSGSETAGALRLDHLNPQTQEFTLP